MRTRWALPVLLGLLLAAGALWQLAVRREPPAPPPRAPAAAAPAGPETPAAQAGDAGTAAFAIHPDRRHLAQPDGPAAPGAMPEVIAYPRVAKLSREPLSAIPHRIVGAWDDTPEPATLGARRAFVLVVSPELSDAELADLARDVRDRHRDADWLTLRVFDSEAAATRPSWTDGGAARAEHLVAELRRNTAGRGEWLRVRGREIDP